MTLPAFPGRLTGAVVFGLLACSRPAAAADADKPAPPSPEAVQFFEAKIRPLLADNCMRCHGPTKQRGGLRLDNRADLLAGGDNGKDVVPGDVNNSLLLQAVAQTNPDLKPMPPPPNPKLSAQQIADLTTWIKMGAPWPGQEKAVASGSTIRRGKFEITDKDRAHWAFQPVKRPAVPTVKNTAWVINPIDAFILAKLDAKYLQPNPPASKRELIRRVTYDVTGLPPTPQEVENFVNDPSPNAYERLVDRLLASPRYGEQWGRHWLDLVRFAETNSYERDGDKPNAWRYRDYVIRAFNEDKPYDQFVREQLAGDEMSVAHASGSSEAIIATGYYRLGIWDDEPSDRDQARYDNLDDVVATTGQVFLGLTVDCARCHDHKIDPIAQKDYYSLLAFFQNVAQYTNGSPADQAPIFGDPSEKPAYARRLQEIEQERRQRTDELLTIEKEFRDECDREGSGPDGAGNKAISFYERMAADGPRLIGEEKVERWRQLQKEIAALVPPPGPAGQALCVTEMGRTAPDTFVLQRGNAHVPSDKVEPRFPQILTFSLPVIPEPPKDARTCGRRLALANWIVSKDDPMAARVIVNRLWQYNFGRGIVRSPNNFGLQGDKPTHAELLDWLASELMDGGWRLKRLQRMILLSNAYRMSSRGNSEGLKADPVNDLFWRFDMRRLTAEEVRDSVLAVSGNLNLKMYGPGVYTDLPRAVLATQSMPGHGWGQSPPEEQARRSIYVHVKRSLLTPILENFDFSETDRSAPVRFATTQPTQALTLLNSDFMQKQAGLFAERLGKEAGPDVSNQVRLGLSLAVSRPPTDEEVKRGLELIDVLQQKDGMTAEAALRTFCLMAINLNEFMYLD
ncbi:MAG TPA: PSD1 and planctomycete cytochrome C domain-containing protein [Gemmataceae bacterium]|nr:PSD1 and planctomycete cytochrome C domain-containing protein [Gemmataceae bacterium]